jgi:hypothetical protein
MTPGQSPLLIRRGQSGQWRSPAIQTYGDEEKLKNMLLDNPELLPLQGEGSVFVDELTVPGIGFVDLAGVDAAGSITLVECKLGTNPEIRRSIIGQIFAYAAGLWQIPYESFDESFSTRLGGVSLADAVRKALPEQRAMDWQAEHFRLSVAENLGAGRFTLIIAVDHITDELKRTVPYVNTHTIPEVKFIALEIGYVQDGDLEIIRPLTYGQESVGEKQASSRRSQWTPEAYLEKLSEYDGPVQDAVRSLVTFSRQHGAEIAGGTGAFPSLNVRFRFGDAQKTVWSSYLYQSNGPSFDLNFDYLRPVVSLDVLAAAAQIMRSIDGTNAKYAGLEPNFRARPSLSIVPVLLQPGAIETVIRALATVLNSRET